MNLTHLMTEPSRANIKVLFALTLVHFTGDFYASFVNPLLPVFVEKYSLTLTQVGLITGISRVLAFVVQPSVGYIADRYRTRLFVLGGTLLSIVFIPLSGIAPFFWVLILFISLGSIGSSMFHPPCAGMVSTYAGRHFGFSMSIFILGGTLAFGVGPIFITSFVRFYSLEASPFTMIIGLVLMIFIFKVLPVPGVKDLNNLGFIGSIKDTLGSVWKSIVLLWIVMVLRAFASQSFMTFIPVLYAKEGYSLVSIGGMVSLFTVGGAISGLIAGHLSDRIGYKPIFFCCSRSRNAESVPIAVSFRQLDFFKCFCGGVFHFGYPAAGGGNGTGTGASGKIYGIEPHDGLGFWHRRHDDPTHRQDGGYLFY